MDAVLPLYPRDDLVRHMAMGVRAPS
jgi:hypothetical protein